jgi:hypothetical protein
MKQFEQDLKALRDAMAELKVWADGQKGNDHLGYLKGPLCHYTDAAGLKGILEKEELWLTSALHLNDPAEFMFGREIAQEILKSYARPGGEDSNTAYFADAIAESAMASTPGIYVASFSQLRDDLSQWRAYGDNGRGVCIEFDPAPFTQFGEFFGGEIRYGEDEAKQRHHPLIEKAIGILTRKNVIGTFFLVSVGAFDGIDCNHILKPFNEMFVWNCLFTKHKAYEAEKELRFAVTGDPEGLRDLVKTRVRGSEIIPYIPLKLTLENKGITRIQLGPAAHPRVQDGIHHLLREHGYDETVLVPQSKIPYRPA